MGIDSQRGAGAGRIKTFRLNLFLAILKRQSSGRANADALAAFQAPVPADGFIGKGCHHSLKTAVGKAKDARLQVLPAYPDAASAEDTLVRVIGEKRVTVVHGEFPQ